MGVSLRSVQNLFAGLIDYAGLFPPAELSMQAAVKNYRHYHTSEHAWMLGRFILPVARFDEFFSAVETDGGNAQQWRLSALVSDDLRRELQRIDEFNNKFSSDGAVRAVVDTIELRASHTEVVAQATSLIPPGLTAFFEVSIDQSPSDMILSLKNAGHHAKVRTGGVTANMFPSAPDLVRFMMACKRNDVAFKATAGLHHPLRASYQLTYEPDSGHATMFGFLNVFLAAAFVRSGMSDDHAIELLLEDSPRSIRFEDDGVTWRSHEVSSEDLRMTRERFATSFGSCSFEEPVDDLKGIRLI